MNKKTIIGSIFTFLIIFSCVNKPNEEQYVTETESISKETDVETVSFDDFQKPLNVTVQKCVFTDLSPQFNFEIVPKYEYGEEIIIVVFDKKGNKIQSIQSESDYGFNCGAESYRTGDGKHGGGVMLIVDDFNFDNLDDIAVFRDRGNSGAYFDFYLQKGNKFVLDEFLTDYVGHYPEINRKEQTMFRTFPTGAFRVSETTYKYSENRWEIVNDTIFEITDDDIE